MPVRLLRAFAWLLVLAGGLMPRSAWAIDVNDVDVAGRDYFVFLSFAGFFNGDCMQFGEEDEFTASNGLIIGTWSIESETVALFFTINFVEVEILSATDAKITAITALDNRILAGMIETDDGDGGFFVGIESDICAVPAKTTPALAPIPESRPLPARTPRRDR